MYYIIYYLFIIFITHDTDRHMIATYYIMKNIRKVIFPSRKHLVIFTNSKFTGSTTYICNYLLLFELN